ncbi:MAG: acyltransferase [Ekhidna sp.]|nr:acyltransferase [Ekhidna sp.]MBC6409736.1 acyltransferase [Ekhidna sp.]MBC6427181.1 acyltransferase [Ekhidna sp.]
MYKLKKDIKNYLDLHPNVKRRVLSLLFKRKPYQTRLKGIFWLITILPKHIRYGIYLSTRLDLVPFNKFRFGKYAKLEKNVVVNNGMGDVIIEDEVQVGIGCVLIGPVKIGKYSGLSQYVRLLGMHHGIDPIAPHHHLPCSTAPIVLGEDVFIGTGTVVMGKKNGETLTLGDYCRIGANSVVMDDIPPYSIAVGNPAKVVRKWDFTHNKWVKVSDKPVMEISPDLVAPLK